MNFSNQQVAEYATLCGPKCFRKYSKTFRRLVMMFLLITQIGFCCAYSIFVAETLHSVIKSLTHNSITMGVHFYMLIELPLMIGFCSIRDLKTLSIFSTLANALQSVGLVIILIALFDNLSPSWERPQFAGFDKLPLYFGTVVYAFEGIGIVLPLQKGKQYIHCILYRQLLLKMKILLSLTKILLSSSNRDERHEGIQRILWCTQHRYDYGGFVVYGNRFLWLFKIW